jgi:hypothetical protein
MTAPGKQNLHGGHTYSKNQTFFRKTDELLNKEKGVRRKPDFTPVSSSSSAIASQRDEIGPEREMPRQNRTASEENARLRIVKECPYMQTLYHKGLVWRLRIALPAENLGSFATRIGIICVSLLLR